MIKTHQLFDLSRTLAAPLLEKTEYPWEALDAIKALILALGPSLPADAYEQIGEHIWIARDAIIFPNNYIAGPCIIGHQTEVRPGAFIRGSALIGDRCVVGNSTEIKNAILFDSVQAPHFNYVGDSILGYHSHLGAGAVTSNVKGDQSSVSVRFGDQCIQTGRKKLGAMIGDYGEIGCHAVLNPGTVIGRHATVYPLSSVRGTVPENHICKGDRGLFPKK